MGSSERGEQSQMWERTNVIGSVVRKLMSSFFHPNRSERKSFFSAVDPTTNEAVELLIYGRTSLAT